MTKPPVRFTADAAKRIVKAVQRVEGTPPPTDQRGRATAFGWNPGIVRAKVTTAVTTGTFAAPSSAGRAQIYHKDSSGAWVASGDPVVTWNDNVLTASIPIGRTVKLGWTDGEWWLVSASCS